MADWILVPANRVAALKALSIKDPASTKAPNNTKWRVFPFPRLDSGDFIVSADVLTHPKYGGALSLLQGLPVETWTEAQELARIDIKRGMD